MTDSPRTSNNIGFLTIVDHPRHGLVGGYLVLNPAGRPLEFHCTSPVKPNSAQRILYGNTLEPYLFGEQIGRVLLSRSKTPVRFVLTDVPAVLPAQEFIEEAIVLVLGTRKSMVDETSISASSGSGYLPGFLADREDEKVREISEELDESLRSFGIENSRLQRESGSKKQTDFYTPDIPGLDVSRWKETKIGNRFLAVPENEPADCTSLVEELRNVSKTVDLAEPFTRIRLAIEEAQRAA